VVGVLGYWRQGPEFKPQLCDNSSTDNLVPHDDVLSAKRTQTSQSLKNGVKTFNAGESRVLDKMEGSFLMSTGIWFYL
jgi:hypothetical protein